MQTTALELLHNSQKRTTRFAAGQMGVVEWTQQTKKLQWRRNLNKSEATFVVRKLIPWAPQSRKFPRCTFSEAFQAVKWDKWSMFSPTDLQPTLTGKTKNSLHQNTKTHNRKFLKFRATPMFHRNWTLSCSVLKAGFLDQQKSNLSLTKIKCVWSEKLTLLQSWRWLLMIKATCHITAGLNSWMGLNIAMNHRQLQEAGRQAAAFQ